MGFNFFNRKASFKYSLEDKLEAGIALTGTEIKSLRSGRMSLAEAFVHIRGAEAFLINSFIPAFQPSPGYDPRRPRKLLLHRSQLAALVGKTSGTNLTLVPVRVYNRRGLAKVEIALAKGKRQFDKRKALKDREIKLEAEQALRGDKLAFQQDSATK